ncbi:Intracellular septation protein IspA [hydrothermal vent metagenome]|uniref:Intracellular septation protein IspA n=1 Tax=hydrothermal vent metagenome TaxID=652676 RepID=A0A3B0ZPE5_9ZZZZ
MKFLFDFFPVVLFFIIFKSYENQVDGMIAATAALMAATFMQIAYNWLRHKKIEKMHIITLVLVIIFGGATIYFKEPQFLIWKVTIANWLFAIVFYASHFIGNKTPIVKRMMQANISMPDSAWQRLSLSWVLFFVLTGIINLLVAHFFDFDTWVDFKLFGILGLTLAFVVVQGVFLTKYINEEDTKTKSNATEPAPTKSIQGRGK